MIKIYLVVMRGICKYSVCVVSLRCDKDPAQLWTEALGVLMTAKELSQVIITREANLEAEILLNLGINNV